MKAEFDELNNLITESLSSCEFKFKLPQELITKNIIISEIFLTDIEYHNAEMIKSTFKVKVKKCK